MSRIDYELLFKISVSPPYSNSYFFILRERETRIKDVEGLGPETQHYINTFCFILISLIRFVV